MTKKCKASKTVHAAQKNCHVKKKPKAKVKPRATPTPTPEAEHAGRAAHAGRPGLDARSRRDADPHAQPGRDARHPRPTPTATPVYPSRTGVDLDEWVVRSVLPHARGRGHRLQRRQPRRGRPQPVGPRRRDGVRPAGPGSRGRRHAEGVAHPRGLHALLLAPGPRGAGHAHRHHRALTSTLRPAARTVRSASRALDAHRQPVVPPDRRAARCSAAAPSRSPPRRARRGSESPATEPRHDRARCAGHASRTRSARSGSSVPCGWSRPPPRRARRARRRCR